MDVREMHHPLLGATDMQADTTATYQPDSMLDTQAAAEVLGLRPQTLHEWRTRRVGPPYRKLGRAVRYVYVEIIAWRDAQRVETH